MNRTPSGYRRPQAKPRRQALTWPFKGRGERRLSNRFVPAKATAGQRKHSWALYCAALLLAGGLLWLLGFSGCFQAKTIEVSQNKNIPAEEVARAVRAYFNNNRLTAWTGHNWLLLDGEELTQALLAEFPLHGLKLHRRYQKLIIELQEKDYTYIWQEADRFYYINREGDIILTKDAAIKGYPLVVNSGSSTLTLKKIQVDPTWLDFVKRLDETLKANNHGLNLRSFVYDTSYNTVKMQLTAGPMLLFNTQADPEAQLAKLDSLRRQEFADGQKFNSLKYIDLRFGERVYFQ